MRSGETSTACPAVQETAAMLVAQMTVAVAHALHGDGTAQAQAWVEPVLKPLRVGQAAKVIRLRQRSFNGLAQEVAQASRLLPGGTQPGRLRNYPPNQL